MPRNANRGFCHWLRRVARRYRVHRAYEFVFGRRIRPIHGCPIPREAVTRRLAGGGPKFVEIIEEVVKTGKEITKQEEATRDRNLYRQERRLIVDDATRNLSHLQNDNRLEHLLISDELRARKNKAEKQLSKTDDEWFDLLDQRKEGQRRCRVLLQRAYQLSQDYVDACFAVQFDKPWCCDMFDCLELRLGKDLNLQIKNDTRKPQRTRRDLLALKMQRSKSRRTDQWSFAPHSGTKSPDRLQEEQKKSERELLILEDVLEMRQERLQETKAHFLQNVYSSIPKLRDSNHDATTNTDNLPAAQRDVTTEQRSPNLANDDAVPSEDTSSEEEEKQEDQDSSHSEGSRQRLIDLYESTEEYLESAQQIYYDWGRHLSKNEQEYLITFTRATSASLISAFEKYQQNVTNAIRLAEGELSKIRRKLISTGVEIPQSVQGPFLESLRVETDYASEPLEDEVEVPPAEHSSSGASFRTRPVDRRKINAFRIAHGPDHPLQPAPPADAGQGIDEARSRSFSLAATESPGPAKRQKLKDYQRHQEHLQGPVAEEKRRFMLRKA